MLLFLLYQLTQRLQHSPTSIRLSRQMYLLHPNLLSQPLLEKLTLNNPPHHLPDLPNPYNQIPVPVFIQIIPDLPVILVWQPSVIHTNFIMLVLYRHHHVPMGGEPTADTAVGVHVSAKAVAKYYDFVRFVGVFLVDIKRGVSDTGHGYFGEEGD